MMWKSAVAIVAVFTLVNCSGSSSKTAASTTLRPTIDPCTLLTAQDASKLIGKPVKRATPAGSSGPLCMYAAGTTAGAEITVRLDADAPTAHSDFPTWVQPFPGRAAGLTVTSVPNLGHEASATHNLNVNDAVYVRRGAALMKIGAYPAVADAALIAAARTALGRIKSAG